MMLTRRLGIVGSLLMIVGCTIAQTKTVRLSIHPEKVIGQIPESIYGHFLEHINNSVNGGLWGEVVWNRSFEESPVTSNSGRLQTSQTSNAPTLSILSRWSIIGEANISSDTIMPLNGRKCIKILATTFDAGLAQNNFFLKKGDALRGSIWLRGHADDGIVVRLFSSKNILAQQKIKSITSAWKEFPLSLNPNASADSGTLQILTQGKAEVWIDQVSLMPNSSHATGGFRPDLLKAIADLKPTSIRWPGGGFASGYNWKNGIGPQEKRIGKGRSNDIDPLALGLNEFITLCRKVGAAPILCVTLGKRDTSELEHYLQEAVDELEYCNGSVNTRWGKVRAANGHPQPYNVKYWEVDNELYLTSMIPSAYLETVKRFSNALRKKDPSVILIGCGGGGTKLTSDKSWSLKMLDGDLSAWDYFSLHQYENYSRNPTGIDSAKFRAGIDDFEKYYAALRDSIAKSNNLKMKVYESEWNYMSIDWRTGLYAGGVLNCFERNGDLVTMACPALFLRHTSTTSWNNALINFDHRKWFPAPNYVVMKLYRDHFAPNRISMDGDIGHLNAIATKSKSGNQVFIKIVNPYKEATDVVLNTSENFQIGKANLKIVADDLDAKNSLDAPSAIAVVEKKLTPDKNTVRLTMPGFSVGVVEIFKR